MLYTAKLKGYETLGCGTTYFNLEIEAEDEKEAKKKALEWCKENTYIGGYEWFLKGMENGKTIMVD